VPVFNSSWSSKPVKKVDEGLISEYLKLMNIEQMKQRLIEAYPNSVVDVIDLTGTSDHWEVYVESQKFSGMSRIQQHQAVMSVFGPELKTGEVHALSIRTKIKE